MGSLPETLIDPLKHYLNPGINTSSVWNFCACSSDVLSLGTSGGFAKCRVFFPQAINLNANSKLLAYEFHVCG